MFIFLWESNSSSLDFPVFHQSYAVITVVLVTGNKRQKYIHLKDEIYENLLDLK